ncbi:hypothetical protein JTB14_037354 [Gonioctena quinquepunctata]|nr:hypothetical protein JTB14_037354 [Gonioctena quinquepunctata]
MEKQLASIGTALSNTSKCAFQNQIEIAHLTTEIGDLEQHQRINSIRIQGLREEVDNEYLLENTSQFFGHSSNISCTKQEIDSIFRINGRQDVARPRPILVKFITNIKKNEIIDESFKEYKHLRNFANRCINAKKKAFLQHKLKSDRKLFWKSLKSSNILKIFHGCDIDIDPSAFNDHFLNTVPDLNPIDNNILSKYDGIYSELKGINSNWYKSWENSCKFLIPTRELIDTDFLETNLKVHSVISTSGENEQRLQKAINDYWVLQKVKSYTLQVEQGVFEMKIAFCLGVITISSVFSASVDFHPLSDEFIDHINNQQSTWKAGRNFDKHTPLSHIRGLLGALETPEHLKKNLLYHEITEDTDIPESFDPRENWPECEIIKEIRDQSSCGSCWAVAAAAAMSDRICIHSKAEKKIWVSDEDLLSCCHLCGFGCSGGYPSVAWTYWQLNGIVSGGAYNSTTGCRAYSMESCEHHSTGARPQCSSLDYSTPKCQKQCDSHSELIYSKDKSHAKSAYLVSSQEKQIQLELLKNGPVEASFTVYSDFVSYKSGVYQYVSGTVQGGHAVRLLGWGVENGVKYWLVANSWNEDWGDRGLFKIIRGKNECGFESGIVAGIPKL